MIINKCYGTFFYRVWNLSKLKVNVIESKCSFFSIMIIKVIECRSFS